MSKLKLLLISFIFFNINLFAAQVLVAKKDISYNSTVTAEDVRLTNAEILQKYCEPITIEMLKSNKYISNRYIKQDTVICTDDISVYQKNSVLFNFGSIQIEQNGKMIFENDEYIKIKKDNGDIEKIYKDGRIE